MTAPSQLLTAAEVGRAFRVDPKSVVRWAKSGKLEAIRTPGNHRRYFRAQVEAILRGEPLTAEQVAALKADYGARR